MRNRKKLECALAILFALSSAACDPTASSGSGLVTCSASARALVTRNGPYLEDKASGALQRLNGHIPRATGGFSDSGKVSEATNLSVTLALELNDQTGLDRELAQIYQPGNSKFHHFLTPSEFRARYAPTDQQVAQVQSFLKSEGLTPLSVSDNHLLVRAQGDLKTLNSVFHTEVHQYQDAQGHSYFAPAYELQIPADLPVQAVHGLQNVTHLRRALPGPVTTGHGGSGPGGGLSPQDIRTAYNVPSTASGTGQTLAVFELDGYNSSDITMYASNFGLPAVPLQDVLIDGSSGSAGGGAAEVTLDIELMMAIAPGAAKIMVYEGPNGDQGILDTYAKIANDNLAQSVSTSWGTAENGTSASIMQTENNIFKQMAAQGQSIYSAAGDSGAYDDGSTLSVDDPSAQPYMVAVGGTSLTVGSGGVYQSETTWNGGSASAGAGGGGISTVWTIPSWQVGAAGAQAMASTTMRNVPDVSLESDIANGYAIYTGGSWGVWGGTSAAAPLWAGFTALVNQQRAANGLGALGFANPLLYQIGKSSRYATDFHDISDGSTNLNIPSVAGYDLATGLGSFNAQNLMSDLSGNGAGLGGILGITNPCGGG